MKPFVKAGSFILSIILIIAAVGCTPISLSAQWAYKTDINELAIGVYIYSLDLAYSQAESYAEELDDYDGSTKAWLDLEITDDDGNTAVARDWIKDEAEKMCLSYLAVDQLIEELGIDVSGATMDSADDQAEEYWDLGQYADYGYYLPMSDDLEPYGISLESFAYATTEYSTKYSAIFNAVYGEGGSKEVTDSDFETYFTENYTDYSYFSVNLYESTTDEDGESTDVALSDEEIEALTEEIDGYVDELNSGASYDEVIEEYMVANDTDTDPSTSSVENLESSSIGDELIEALEELDSNSAAAIQVGDGDTAVYYLIYKRDINDDIDDYVYDDTERSTLLSAMKSEEFSDYIEEVAGELEYEKNDSAINKYKPDMFFVKTETTAADESSDSDE